MRSLLSCQADEDVEWTDIKRNAVEAIDRFFESGDPITTGAVYHESSEYATGANMSHLGVKQLFDCTLYCKISPHSSCSLL